MEDEHVDFNKFGVHKRVTNYSCGCVLERYSFSSVELPEECGKHGGRRIGEEKVLDT
jgi:hypothetical protein